MSNESPDPNAPTSDVQQPTEEKPDPVAVLTAERDRLKDAALRAMADLDNYRKRSRKEIEETGKKAREDLLRELLPVFDNLERALHFTSTSADPKAIAKGIEMVLRLFEDSIGKIGGKRIRAVGQTFDPTQHEAIQQIESHEHPAGTITHEELPGYVLHDRLLRPAMVVVSKGPAAGSGDSEPKN